MDNGGIRISVRNLIEFILRRGNIDSSYMGNKRAQEGTRAHQYLQKENSKIYEEYKKEVYFKHIFERESMSISVEGRADGIIKIDDRIIIEEIKSTTKELVLIEEDNNMLHWAQVKFYGYMYLIENDGNSIELQLTYIHLDSNETKKFNKVFELQELEEFVNFVVDEYIKWALFTLDWVKERNNSIKSLEFPFERYRKGQREFAVVVYNTIKSKGMLFAQAPTGIGKTISTLFPAIKSLGEELSDRIFYLTAKTITRTVAEESLRLIRDKKVRIKSITLTAKDKICFNSGSSCNAEECAYAQGFYDKVNEALFDIINNEDEFTREKIETYSKRYGICPFEFSLEISNWSDVIIGDYNYVFDPRVYLKRFFDESSEKYTFLIDEAHNLVSRGREMFSAILEKRAILNAKKILKGEKKLIKYLNKINTYLISLKKDAQDKDVKEIIVDEPTVLYEYIRGYLKECDEFLVTHKDFPEYEQILDLYFQLNTFINISGFYDENYLTIVKLDGEELILKLFCINPSKNLREGMNRSNSKIVFSATLSPGNYFIELLGGSEESYKMSLPSPFPEKNLLTLIAPISTRYKHREATINKIISMILEFVKAKRGNYMCFFPSYKYMKQAQEILDSRNEDIIFIMQKDNMSEEDKEEFLKEFKEPKDKSQLGLCVLGGVFSEGIDLTGDSLIGAIIVGVGLPQISFEQDLIKDFFKEKGEGYDYAYTYPGINKVMQAVGRVIRREEDKGATLLIDDRFISNKYLRLMPENWRDLKIVRDKEDIIKEMDDFWS
ncbi:ATP-dependent DNA helicase [Clostridium paridis]|uniref:ATP-dependent DNA helicase n=1 Tax=Clostridium paridis TaxID=2803863 RepID=A0A937FHE7_9CLOT|nr:ATP-dependent DNA helicase [Clostridium paridis]MBL4931476.1 ATP-dependent DNA helicase [Clostridium paridis]